MNDVDEVQPTKLPAKRMEPADGKLTLARKNDLQKLLKTMEKATPEAINLLLEALQDTNTDVKIRVDIAKTLLDTRIKLSESISRDQLQRTIGEHRMRLAEQPQRKITDVSEDDTTPQAVFVPHAILNCDSQNV